MKTIKKIVAVFLALIFLTSSLGFTVNKMVCAKSGETKFSLSAIKNCCANKKSTYPVLKKQCCKITNTYFHLSNFQNNQKVRIDHSFAIQKISVRTLFSIKLLSALNSEYSIFANNPPHLHGRQLLSFISVLTI